MEAAVRISAAGIATASLQSGEQLQGFIYCLGHPDVELARAHRFHHVISQHEVAAIGRRNEDANPRLPGSQTRRRSFAESSTAVPIASRAPASPLAPRRFLPRLAASRRPPIRIGSRDRHKVRTLACGSALPGEEPRVWSLAYQSSLPGLGCPKEEHTEEKQQNGQEHAEERTSRE